MFDIPTVSSVMTDDLLPSTWNVRCRVYVMYSGIGQTILHCECVWLNILCWKCVYVCMCVCVLKESTNGELSIRR